MSRAWRPTYQTSAHQTLSERRMLLVWRPTNKFTKMQRFAKTETGTGSTLPRETVRDPSASFALLTGCGMTVRDRYSEAICGTC